MFLRSSDKASLIILQHDLGLKWGFGGVYTQKFAGLNTVMTKSLSS